MKNPVKLVVLLLLLGQSYAFAQSSRITGKVTGPDKEGLPGVNVQVEGTTTGTATDAAGNFVLNALGYGFTHLLQYRLYQSNGAR